MGAIGLSHQVLCWTMKVSELLSFSGVFDVHERISDTLFQVFSMCTADCFSSSFFLTCAKALLLEVDVVKDVAKTLG